MDPVTMWVVGGLAAGFVMLVGTVWRRAVANERRVDGVELQLAALGDRFVSHGKCGEGRDACQDDLKTDLDDLKTTNKETSRALQAMAVEMAKITTWIEQQDKG